MARLMRPGMSETPRCLTHDFLQVSSRTSRDLLRDSNPIRVSNVNWRDNSEEHTGGAALPSGPGVRPAAITAVGARSQDRHESECRSSVLRVQSRDYDPFGWHFAGIVRGKRRRHNSQDLEMEVIIAD